MFPKGHFQHEGASLSVVVYHQEGQLLVGCLAAPRVHGFAEFEVLNSTLAQGDVVDWARRVCPLELHADSLSSTVCSVFGLQERHSGRQNSVVLEGRTQLALSAAQFEGWRRVVGHKAALARASGRRAEGLNPLYMCGLPPCRMQSASSPESPRKVSGSTTSVEPN